MRIYEREGNKGLVATRMDNYTRVFKYMNKLIYMRGLIYI